MQWLSLNGCFQATLASPLNCHRWVARFLSSQGDSWNGFPTTTTFQSWFVPFGSSEGSANTNITSFRRDKSPFETKFANKGEGTKDNQACGIVDTINSEEERCAHASH